MHSLFYFTSSFARKVRTAERKNNNELFWLNETFFYYFQTVMGLQKIFSATTAVVGLFISVDYGLCDEFRCRGVDLGASVAQPTIGWQGHAVWTILYLAGLALWTLHLSLLEGEIVQFNDVSLFIDSEMTVDVRKSCATESDTHDVI